MYDPKAVIVINFFENTWNCSGLCEPIGYYIFSDVFLFFLLIDKSRTSYILVKLLY